MRVWLACERCGCWNIPSVDTCEALVLECQKILAGQVDLVSQGGIGHATLAGLRLTTLDSDSPDTLLTVRHARRIGSRTNRGMWLSGAVVAVSIPVMLASSRAWGHGVGTFTGCVAVLGALIAIRQLQQRRRFSIRLSNGETLTLTRGNATQASLVAYGVGWALWMPTSSGERILRGVDALVALARIIPLFQLVSDPHDTEEAVRLLRRSPDMDSMVAQMAPSAFHVLAGQRRRFFTSPASIWALPVAQRLALEMMATERVERDQLALESVDLRRQQQVASEIADIIDEEFPIS